MFYFCLSIGLFIMALFLFPVAIYALGAFGFLKDKDPYETKCDGLNCDTWVQEYICDKCMSFSSHDERITRICLSCGGIFDWTNGRIATRNIVFNGKWARQINWNNKVYVDKALMKNN